MYGGGDGRRSGPKADTSADGVHPLGELLEAPSGGVVNLANCRSDC